MGSIANHLVVDGLFFRDSLVLLLSVMNPLAVAALFMSMTVRYSKARRTRMARRGAAIALGILIFFALSGEWILRILGISIDDFRIAGGVLLFVMGFSMLRSDEPEEQLDSADLVDVKGQPDLSITPLAVPLVAGPGGISGTILRVGEVQSMGQRLMLILAICMAVLLTYLLVDGFARGSKMMGKMLSSLVYRISGLILIALAVQFILVGFEGLEFFRQLFRTIGPR